MWWCFCSLKWEQVDHLMGSKGWWLKEDLLPKTSKQSWGDTLMSMSSAMVARALIPFYPRRIVCSSFVASSVDLQGLLLQSRLDSLLKLVAGRPEHKTKLWIVSPMSCHMVLELSSCSVLATNFALRPLWPSFFFVSCECGWVNFWLCGWFWGRINLTTVGCCAMLSYLCHRCPLSLHTQVVIERDFTVI